MPRRAARGSAPAHARAKARVRVRARARVSLALISPNLPALVAAERLHDQKVVELVVPAQG